MPRLLLACITCATVMATGTVSANDVSVRAINTWTTDGYVSGAAAGNGVVYLAGSFSSFGPRTGAMAAIDRATNLPLDWPRFTGGSIATILADPDDGYIVHGTFRFVDGRPVNGLVRLTAGGQIDPAFQWTRTEGLLSIFLAGDRLVVTASLVNGTVSAIVNWRTGQVIAGPLSMSILGAGTGPGGALIARVVVPPAQSGVVQLNATTGAIDRVIYSPPGGTNLSAMVVAGAQAFVATGGITSPSGHVLRVDLASGVATTLATVSGTSAGRFVLYAVTKILPHRGLLYPAGQSDCGQRHGAFVLRDRGGRHRRHDRITVSVATACIVVQHRLAGCRRRSSHRRLNVRDVASQPQCRWSRVDRHRRRDRRRHRLAAVRAQRLWFGTAHLGDCRALPSGDRRRVHWHRHHQARRPRRHLAAGWPANTLESRRWLRPACRRVWLARIRR